MRQRAATAPALERGWGLNWLARPGSQSQLCTPRHRSGRNNGLPKQPDRCRNPPRWRWPLSLVTGAEAEGFEPPEPLGSLAFKGRADPFGLARHGSRPAVLRFPCPSADQAERERMRPGLRPRPPGTKIGWTVPMIREQLAEMDEPKAGGAAPGRLRPAGPGRPGRSAGLRTGRADGQAGSVAGTEAPPAPFGLVPSAITVRDPENRTEPDLGELWRPAFPGPELVGGGGRSAAVDRGTGRSGCRAARGSAMGDRGQPGCHPGAHEGLRARRTGLRAPAAPALGRCRHRGDCGRRRR